MKSVLRWIMACFLFVLAAFVAEAADTTEVLSEDVLPGYLTSSWGKLTSTLGDALNLRDKQDTLPESSYFGTNKTKNAKKIDALLEKALEILLQGDAQTLRKQSIALREQIPALRLEMDDLRNKRISAPEESNLPWVQTRSKIDERLAVLEAEYREKTKELEALNGKIASALRALGLDMDEKQIDILLTSVTGDDLFQNTVVFANVKRVVEKLAELSREDRDNLDINRRYTGMYLILNDLLIYIQEDLISKIDVDYLPQLSAIQGEAEALRKEAAERSRQSMYTPAQKKAFEANASSNAMTVRVAGLYMELLQTQRTSVQKSLAELRRNRDVAENTYKTVRSSGDLRSLIRSGLELFDSIQALSMPSVPLFENEMLRQEFEEINRRLKK